MRIRQLASFGGRATRTQYILGQLATCTSLYVCAIFFSWLDKSADIASPAAELLYLLVNFVGGVLVWLNLAVSVRRLHDFNRSGWWVLPGSILGAIFTIILACSGPVDPNHFGYPSDSRDKPKRGAYAI
jgi:uncharacterized membrane protein YhaH (DUF805 family)